MASEAEEELRELRSRLDRASAAQAASEASAAQAREETAYVLGEKRKAEMWAETQQRAREAAERASQAAESAKVCHLLPLSVSFFFFPASFARLPVYWAGHIVDLLILSFFLSLAGGGRGFCEEGGSFQGGGRRGAFPD